MARIATALKAQSGRRIGRAENAPEIQNDADANRALEQIGRLADQIGQVEARENEVIRLAMERKQKDTESERAQIKELEEKLESYAEKARKSWLQKSVDLLFGTLGFRSSPDFIKLVKPPDKVIALLKENNMANCVRVREEIEKRALWGYDDEALKKVGCEKASGEESFFYKLKPRAPAAPSQPR